MTDLVCHLNDRDRLRLSFRERGMAQVKLAALAKLHPIHVNQVMTNKPGKGRLSRERLFPHLTADEIKWLGWTSEYDAWRSTLCSTENKLGNYLTTKREQ